MGSTTHQEQLNVTNFNELIQCVKPDGYPALIQVTLNFIHQHFSGEEGKLKLAFLLVAVAYV